MRIPGGVLCTKPSLRMLKPGCEQEISISPFPEEMNRVLNEAGLTALHFAATEAAAVNLRREGIRNEAIWVTGNPVIDAVKRISEGLISGRITQPTWPWRNESKKLILVTAHRRVALAPRSPVSAGH